MKSWFYGLFIGIVMASFSVAVFSASANGPVRILSIDGGGVRGIIPALMLEKIEKELNKPIHEIFDFVAGSSSGGIIAIGLTSPNENNQAAKTASEMVNFYITESTSIFSSSMTHWLRNIGGLIGPKYESGGLRKLLEKNVGSARLSEALVPTLITGYHMEGEAGIEFFSEDAKEFPLDKDCYMTDVGMATAAAPAYFETVDIEFPWGTLRSIADGGLYKHNPALLAYVNAKKLYPDRKIEIYSLGTGHISAESLDTELKGRGFVQWISPILRHLHIGDSEVDSAVLQKLLNENGEQNYFRIDVPVNRKHSAMDKTSEENIRYLYNRGIDATNSYHFKKLITRLKLGLLQ